MAKLSDKVKILEDEIKRKDEIILRLRNDKELLMKVSMRTEERNRDKDQLISKLSNENAKLQEELESKGKKRIKK
ncbi:MAG TPA: hypothetical protein ENN46_03620 [Candidatus Woesearchaeota archaeon]|nr:hypothetical protein [Candidatus Woesearchaeota archaeon]